LQSTGLSGGPFRQRGVPIPAFPMRKPSKRIQKYGQHTSSAMCPLLLFTCTKTWWHHGTTVGNIEKG